MFMDLHSLQYDHSSMSWGLHVKLCSTVFEKELHLQGLREVFQLEKLQGF